MNKSFFRKIQMVMFLTLILNIAFAPFAHSSIKIENTPAIEKLFQSGYLPSLEQFRAYKTLYDFSDIEKNESQEIFIRSNQVAKKINGNLIPRKCLTLMNLVNSQSNWEESSSQLYGLIGNGTRDNYEFTFQKNINGTLSFSIFELLGQANNFFDKFSKEVTDCSRIDFKAKENGYSEEINIVDREKYLFQISYKLKLQNGNTISGLVVISQVGKNLLLSGEKVNLSKGATEPAFLKSDFKEIVSLHRALVANLVIDQNRR